MNVFKKKSLGQHFLKNKSTLARIVHLADLPTDMSILEIGPGDGALTHELLARGYQVTAIEIDERMVQILQEKFAAEIESNQLTLTHADVMEYDLEDFYKKTDGRYALVANIPYYITGMIMRKFLESATQPQLIAVVMQKEVAERIVAHDNKESLLSQSIAIYGTPQKAMNIGRKQFTPPPKVDSALLIIRDISKKKFVDQGLNEQLFFNVIRTGFRHKRKMLMNNLKKLPHVTENNEALQSLGALFLQNNIDEKARPQELTQEMWIAIALWYQSRV